MPSIAVRQRYELHLVAERSILGGETSGSEIAVVGMCAEGNDAHRPILRQGRRRRKQ
jgi:hypothetical protein